MRPCKPVALALAALSLGLPQSFSQSKTTSTGGPDPNAERILETQKVERLLPHLADPGAALFFLASRYAQLGSAQKAIDSLKACVSREQGFDPADVRAFQSLSS